MTGPAIDADGGQPTHGGIRLLRQNPAFRTLWSARVISYAGDSLSLVALIFHVADSTGQAFAIAVLLLVGDFAPALLGPLTGALSDRFDLRRVMITAELVQGGMVLLIAVLLPPLPVLLALVAVRAIAGQVFQPASRAAVPALVPDRHLEAANSTVGFGTNGGEAIGPLLAAALFPLMGVRGVLLVDAVSFLLSAVLLATLPRMPVPAGGDAGQGSLLRDARAGLGYLWSTPVVRVVALGFCAVVAFNGVDDVALVLLATKTFDAEGSAVGLLLGAVGVGLFVGYLLLSRYGMRVSTAGLLIAGFAISSVGNLLTGLAWAVGAAIVMQAVRGLGIAAMDVASSTLLQRAVPEAMLGRVFGNLYGAIGIAAALSYLGGALLLDATSPPTTLLVAGAGGTLATAVTAWALRRGLNRSAGSAEPEQRKQPPPAAVSRQG
ncbi:MFS transporter [Micromonospora parathelypteridis]|uniref:MFS family permease n=1 Tax=Micromonospora parathelypteridis TaxID=1839617 RepID=A0A840VH35_9ACTN|nr:MFS transporter [Micromonospora parathelypteridis]MBB5475965.1 MFS family permease [Micromonospora parathelypteridis]GGO32202.1 MFS transporter [Micromonospora parathelypteridis]